MIDRSAEKRDKRIILFAAVALNLLALFYYKYFMFALHIYNRVAGHINWINEKEIVNVVLPVGISFFTFQGMSYVIDVYRGNTEVQKNIAKVALYISLFPQLVAGPIVRYSDICREIDSRTIKIDNITDGTFRFIYGLGKKVIIADVLAEAVDEIFVMNCDSLTTGLAWIGAVGYTLQIFFDFSGYSDMAIGLGKIFGFSFPENFNSPYSSSSIGEFWRRWHMTLGSWFRDYLYIPLGGSRKGNVYVNLLVVFLFTGIWHGAAFTFVIWGLWHGFWSVVERILRKKANFSVPRVVSWLYTIFVVIIGWVFFRSDNLGYAVSFIKVMFGLEGGGFNYINIWHYINTRMIATFILACLLTFEVPRRIKGIFSNSLCIVDLIRYPFAIVVFAISLMMVVNGNYSPFIYFRF